MIETILALLRAGGYGMSAIAVMLVLTLAIAIERARFHARIGLDPEPLLDAVERCMHAAQADLAIRLCDRIDSPISRVVRAAVMCDGEAPDQVAAATDMALQTERRRVRGTTGYLPMIAQIAALMGILGAITGLSVGFDRGRSDCWYSIEPGCRARLVACAIGETLNCTAFGLIATIMALSVYALVHGRSAALSAALDQTAARVVKIVARSPTDAAD